MDAGKMRPNANKTVIMQVVFSEIVASNPTTRVAGSVRIYPSALKVYIN
jgi:hypothetical protein